MTKMTFSTLPFRAAGLQCHIVTGINKSASYEVGSRIDPDVLRAQWNAVYVEGEWRMCDPFWASSYVKSKKTRRWALVKEDGTEEVPVDTVSIFSTPPEDENIKTFNDFYFLTNPDVFICTHLPKEKKWQQLDRPFTQGIFERYAYLRERFFEMDMKLIEGESQDVCVVVTRQGQLKLLFGLKEGTSESLLFQYNLYRAKDPNANEESASIPLNQYVVSEKTEDRLEYNITFPVTGRFRLDLFGKVTEEHESFELVCAYIIECPVAYVEDYVPYDPRVEIRFPCETDSYTVLQGMRNNAVYEKLLRQRDTIVKHDGNDVVFYLKLPPESKEAYLVYADEPKPYGEDTGAVVKYMKSVMKPGIYKHPYPDLYGGILGKTYLADELKIEVMEKEIPNYDEIEGEGNEDQGREGERNAYRDNEKQGSEYGDRGSQGSQFGDNEGLGNKEEENKYKAEDGEGNQQEEKPKKVQIEREEPDDRKNIKVINGNMKLDFSIPDDNLELLMEVSHKSMDPAILDQIARKEIDGTKHSYTVDLPEKGEYGFKVFARQKDDPDRVYHVYTCVADYGTEAEDSNDAVNHPDEYDVEMQQGEVTIQ